MKILARYQLRSPTRVLLGYFSSVPTSSTLVRAVTVGVGCGYIPSLILEYVRHVCSPVALSLIEVVFVANLGVFSH
jgi:hypothetical protein